MRKRKAAESLAARFAAKEAGAKALGTGISRGVNWLEIEVVREPGGRPALRFHGRAAEIAAQLGAARSALSLTHTEALATASVLLEDSAAAARA
jgi:holo-[acyl-carrier protein] synthase